jgi:hypothetical protein
MGYSFTGIAYSILSLTIGLLTYRTFNYWKKEKDRVSKIWFYASFSLLLFAILKTIVGLFFAKDPVILEMSIDAGSFFQAISYSALVYFVFYVKFYPRISPWWGAFPALLLGIASTISSINTKFIPFLEPSGSINWGVPSPFSLSVILRVILFFITFIPAIIVLSEQFKKSENVRARRKALGFMLVFFSSIIIGLFDFFLINLLKLDAIWRDIGFVVLSVVVIIILLSTWKRDVSEKS